MKTKRILVLAPKIGDATSLYRTVGPLKHLRKEMDIEWVLPPDNKVSWELLCSVDLVYMQRPFGETSVSIAESIKEQGLPLWIDYDDDFTCVPLSNPTYHLFKNSSSVQRHVELADIVTVSTKALADKYYSKTVHIPNALDDDYAGVYELSKVNPRKKRITWRGSSTHEMDIIANTDKIKRLFSLKHDHDYVFFGFNSPTVISWGFEKAKFLAGDEFHRYIGKLTHSCPDIHIVPLDDSPFNRAKSNIAWIEATLAGARVLATPLPEFRVPGCGSLDDFESGSVKESWDYIRSELMLSKINQKRKEIIENLLK